MATLPYLNNIISFNNINKRPKIDKTKVENWLNNVALSEKAQIENLSYNFCTDEYLLQVNREHLGHDYYTDIITFDLSDRVGIIEGDLYLSIDRIKDNAMLMGVSFELELLRVMVHGLLHLLGYGDKTKREIVEMRAKEAKYLAKY